MYSACNELAIVYYKMYVTFIPFLLGAIVSIDNVEKWTLGPEYMFKLNKVTAIYNTATPIIEELTATVKCQPKFSDILICCIQNITFLTILNHKNNTKSVSLERFDTEQVFEMSFSKRGVQSVVMELNFHVGLNIVKWIVEQFNVGIDLKIKYEHSMTSFDNVKAGLHIIYSFTDSENIWKNSKCNTSYSIIYKSHNEFYFNTSFKEISHSKIQENNDFQFVVLSIPYMEYISQIFSINRHRGICTNHQPRYVKLQKQVWNIHKVTTYINKIEIKDKAFKFVSYTHLEGKLLHQISDLIKTPLFKERVSLNLIEIKPASNKLFINKKWIFQNIDVEKR